MDRLDALHRRPEELLDAREALARALLRDLEDLRLGDVQQLVGCLAATERLGDDLGRDLDQPSEKRLLLDDASVVLDVRRRRHRVDEEADVILAARPFQIAAPLQLVGQGERIDDAAALRDREHTAEQPPMTLGVEHRVVDDLHGAHDRVLVDEHGGEHGLLGVLRPGGTPIAVGVTPQRGGRDRVFDGQAGHLPR